MPAIAAPIAAALRLPGRAVSHPLRAARRRRTTIDLIHASPHLLRDIGVEAGRVSRRGP